MKLLVTVDGRAGELEFNSTPQGCRFVYRSERGDSQLREASLVQVEPGIYSILLAGRSYEAKVVTGPEGYYVDLAGHRSVVEVRDPRSFSKQGRDGTGEGRQVIGAPMPGKIMRVLVAEGARVEPGDGLVVVEAMKMQNELKATQAGVVIQLKAVVGATVSQGEILAVIE